MDSLQEKNVEHQTATGNDEANITNKEDEGVCIYLPYNPTCFSLQHLYRPQHDIVGAAIVQAGMDGVDRYTISTKLGINANCKAGNRIVSNSIHAAKSAYPQLLGEYQKMDGRFRVKKYYLKCAENVPGGKTFTEYSTRFKDLTGMDCPFKLGEMLKFPGQNLNTLRITDITLKRLVQILEFVYQQKAIVTHLKIGSLITAKEHEEGYKFVIDRRSVKKLVLALVRHRLLNVMSLEVQERNQTHRVEVITIPTVASIDDPNVAEAYDKIVSEYKEGNKSFPSGHQIKREVVKVEMPPETQEEEEKDNGIESNETKQEPNTPSAPGSLLHKTFITLDRIQFQQKYGKKGGPSIDLLSQKSLHSLVESVKSRKKSAGTETRKRKKVKKEADDEYPTTSLITKPIAEERRKLKRQHAYSVRLIDNVDKLSVQHKAYLRSRFTQRERDMLLLIRACSSFLNPINRFWPHPKVLRNLMHEFVPESRTKTSYSLMAAGVRELKERQPQQQYLVKTMASYPELLHLRNQMASMNFALKALNESNNLRQKDYFFVDAFRKAYQLLFKESENFPSIYASDLDFGRFIDENNLHFVQVSDTKSDTIPLRSQKPEDKRMVNICVSYNAIMSIMHIEDKKLNSTADLQLAAELDAAENGNGTSTESDAIDDSNFLIEQIGLKQLSETIGKLRSDGIITKKRTYPVKSEKAQNGEEEGEEMISAAVEEDEVNKAEDETQQEPIRKAARLTQFYQHYFDSLFHKNLARNIIAANKFMEQNAEMATFGEFEDPAQFIILANQICNDKKKSIEFNAPDSLKELFILKKEEAGFENDDQNRAGPSTTIIVKDEEIFNARPTKQMRYLENSELCLERLKINVDSLDVDKIFKEIIDELPKPKMLLINSMKSLIPKEKMPAKSNEEQTETTIESNDRVENDQIFDGKHKKIFNAINQTGVIGALEEDLMLDGIASNLDELRVQLKPLLDSSDIFACGIDKRRYVATRNGREWLLENKSGEGFVVKPWSLPNGEINWKILSWMLEGVFSHIYASPGLLLNELIGHFSFVLQPSMILEILEILQTIGCCTLQTKQIHLLRKNSPFGGFNNTEEIKLILPNPVGMERLIFFNNFKIYNPEMRISI